VKLNLTAILSTLIVAVFGGCVSHGERHSLGQSGLPVSLAKSTRSIQELFNSDKSKLRVLALLSPT
jgi:hypothetical protein